MPFIILSSSYAMRPAKIQPTSPCTVHVHQATLAGSDGISPVVWDPTGAIKSQMYKVVYVYMYSAVR